MQFTLVKHGDQATITAYSGGQVYVAQSDHPNFHAILDALVEAEPTADITPLFDIPRAIEHNFRHLSDRVSVANNRVFLGGDEMHSALSDQIVRVLEAGEDFGPIVKFLEKVQANPNPHSRDQLYTWLDTHQFSITGDGDVIGYKGCERRPDGRLQSQASGWAIVDGERVDGKVPNSAGSVVEMPRSEVVHDPYEGCSFGLHVGTHDYATSYARHGAMLEVHVNPRDVVSVPTECGHAKMRVCRYRVIQEIGAQYREPIVFEDTLPDEGERRRPSLRERLSRLFSG